MSLAGFAPAGHAIVTVFPNRRQRSTAMILKTRCIQELPKLSWLSTLDFDSAVLDVVHGTHVEKGKDWLVEGVWDGEFESAEFHRSENFFGSGIRVHDDAVYFVPSSALVDRLIFCTLNNQLLVSNSVPLLLAATGARLDPDHNYHHESYAIVAGVQKYDKRFAVLHPELSSFMQQYEENIVVRGSEISFESRTSKREIGTFAEYSRLMHASLKSIEGNYTSSARRFAVSAYTAMSTGYDSPAVSVLAREIGVRTAFTSRRSTSGIPVWLSPQAAIDDAKPIADCLGIDTIYLDPRRSQVSDDEIYFLATTTAPPEIIFHSMVKYFRQHCEVAMLFTGYHGDKVWDVHAAGKYLTDELIRGDTSGLNLGEIRLFGGFFHVALPFMFAKSMSSIASISQSQEMSSWKLGTAYDRPIPRRIVEEAGVPRELFGVRKKGAIFKYNYPLNKQLRNSFFKFVRESFGVRRTVVHLVASAEDTATAIVSLISRVKALVLGGVADPHPVILSKRLDIARLMFLWAHTSLAERLGAVLLKSGTVRTSGGAARKA